jgi:solute carrier family 25 carnitine/acylcarnitine transporter 20/29
MSHPYPLPYPEHLSGTRPSFLHVARQIHANEGLRGFYRGLAPCFIRAFPSNACAFFVYEGLLRALGAQQVRLPLIQLESKVKVEPNNADSTLTSPLL